MKTTSLDRSQPNQATSSPEPAPLNAQRAGAKLKTGVKAGVTPKSVVWTYTNGGVTHEDTWNTQTLALLREVFAPLAKAKGSKFEVKRLSKPAPRWGRSTHPWLKPGAVNSR